MESTGTDSDGNPAYFLRVFAASSRTPRTASPPPEKIAAAVGGESKTMARSAYLLREHKQKALQILLQGFF